MRRSTLPRRDAPVRCWWTSPRMCSRDRRITSRSQPSIFRATRFTRKAIAARSGAPHARVIHVDIDPAEIGKNRHADIPIVGDVKRVLQKLNRVVAELAPEGQKTSGARKAWWKQVRAWKEEHPLVPISSDTEIKP